MALENVGKALRSTINKIRGSAIVDQKVVDEVVRDLQRALLSADVNVKFVMELTERVRKEALTEKLPPGVSRKDYVIKVLYDELTRLLGKRYYPLELDRKRQNKLMFIGIQGSGKTTSLAKLARYLQKRGYHVGVIAGDTFRPGAYQQLVQLLSPYNIEVYGDEKEKNAVKVVKRGLEHFSKNKKINVILIDTAGRHKEEKGLLKEMKQIAKVAKPDEIILVIDGTIGQQALTQADAFNRATTIGSIIVTKLDGSAKGGGALSAVAATGAKIRFIGDGEKIDDLEAFDPVRFVGNLLGMGDLQGILERIAEAYVSPETQMEIMEAFERGKLTLKHYYMQLEQFQNRSMLKRLLQKLPGMADPLTAGFDQMGEERIKTYLAICRSMTPEELDNYKIIRGSRIQRIARGAGTTPETVKQFLQEFKQLQTVLKQMRKQRRRGQGMPQIPGMSGNEGAFPPL